MRQRRTLTTRGGMRAACGSIAISLTALCAVPVRADEDPDYHRRALKAFTEARYEQALQLFSLGYADTKQPELLIRIGQTYLKLGRNAEALQACESYVSRVENPNPLYKQYALQCIAEAKRPVAARQPAPGPGSAQAPAPPAAAPSPPLRPAEPTPPPPSSPLGAAATPPSPQPVSAAPASVVPANAEAASAPPASAPPASAPPVSASPASAPAAVSTTSSVPPPVNLNSAYDRCLKLQREGRTDAARSCYLDFLPGALRLGGIPDGDVGPLMTQLQRFPEPSSAFPPLLRQHEDRRNTGLWAAGLTMWLCALVPAVAFAPLYAERDSANKNVYYTMAVPIVGPFIAGTWLPLTYAPGDTRNDQVKNFTVPWIVADGLAQLIGFTMFLGGVQTRRVAIPPAVERVLSSTRIAPYGSSDGGGIAAIGRF